ncbi:MAG: hypothetical protein HYV26_17210 [Candidatus Hydrogenedentes bacterium]|nr:hypothetical protein [Candidatus Hydrogenedentota bacterium]
MFPPAHRTPLEEEQCLCNEAVRTGAFDMLTDAEWIALCEQKALGARIAAEEDAMDDSIPVR